MTVRALRPLRIAAIAAAAAISLTALPAASTATAAPVAPAPASSGSASVTAGPSKLRVATYNVRCSACGKPSWESRRSAVVANIKSRNLDVVGIQEASQGWLTKGGHKIDLSQFEDLRNRLGGTWTLANAARNNCVKSKTPTRCVHADQGASQGDKILYRADRVEKLDEGSELLPGVAGRNDRYVAWAQLRQRSTGKRFMFSSTHFAPGNDSKGSTKLNDVRIAEARSAIAEVRRHNPENLPVIFVGDLNSSRFERTGNGPHDVLTGAGLVDPLGQTYRSTRTAPGATVEKRVNTWLNSYNAFERTAKGYRDWKTGSHIDYILTSGLRVSEFEVVARLDSKKKKFVGTIPSDHNMLRADVWLP